MGYLFRMKTVPIQELKRNLAALVDAAAGGEQILITRHNRPVAMLTPAVHEAVRTGTRFGEASIRPLEGLALDRPIAAVLADDRSVDR